MASTQGNSESVVEKQRDRSTSYPAISLDKAGQYIAKVSSKLGNGPYDRDSLAKAMDYTAVSGASASAIAGLVHFGMLDRKGNSYAMSPLAMQVLRPVDEQEKANALREALGRPKLYAALLDAYRGQALPLMLENILTRQYGIAPNAAGRAADAFRMSCEFLGILQNGILVDAGAPSAPVAPPALSATASVLAPRVVVAQTPPAHAPAPGESPFPLAGGARLIVPAALMDAFAAGEFGAEYRALRAKIAAWVAENEKGTADA